MSTYEYRAGTPIDPKDIRKGDLVRRIDAQNGDVVIWEYVASGPNSINRSYEFHLIERPKPEFAPGQVWEGRVSGVRYLTVWRDSSLIAFGLSNDGMPHFAVDAEFLDRNRSVLEYVGLAEITVKP